MRIVSTPCLAALTGCFAFGAIAATKPLIVQAQDNIYGAGLTSAPGGGNVPTASIPVSGPQCVRITSVKGSIACAEKAGCITFNDTQTVPNDPDGIGAAPGTSPNTGTSVISGMNAPHAGYLTGVFIPAGGPSGTLPPALDFTTRRMGTGFSHISPLLDQTFFIGDGRRGDAKGTRQTFNVPAKATALVLGLSDSCDYNGPPSCYDDNAGEYAVTYTATAGSCP
jgi:hypothetical protein